jgi:hypothetical protein
VIERQIIEAEFTFRTRAEGGREEPIPPGMLVGLMYRPHIVIGDPTQREAIVGPDRVIVERYLGVAFSAGPYRIVPGEQVRVEMMLAYWPSLDYVEAVPGATFTVREGGCIVGYGRIMRRWTEQWKPAG